MSQEQDYMAKMDKYYSKRQKIKEYIDMINLEEMEKVQTELEDEEKELTQELSEFKKLVDTSISDLNKVSNV